METTTLKYELSNDGLGLKRWFRTKDDGESFYHVHSDEMTELEQWIHGMLSRPNASDGYGRRERNDGTINASSDTLV